tara:strand:- start:100 stop:528 length:429 start_codon:yes stop_codon:yes gene_type:complete
MIYNINDLFNDVESSMSFKHYIKDQIVELICKDKKTKFNYFENYIKNNIIFLDINDKMNIVGLIISSYRVDLFNKTIFTITHHLIMNGNSEIRDNLLDKMNNYIKKNYNNYEIFLISNEKKINYYEENNFININNCILKLTS